MARRKQQHPRALLGPKRDLERLNPTSSVDLVRAPVGSVSAIHGLCVLSGPDSIVTSTERDDTDTIPLRPLAVDCKELSSITGTQLSVSLVHEGCGTILWEIKGPDPESIAVSSVSALLHVSFGCFPEFLNPKL